MSTGIYPFHQVCRKSKTWTGNFNFECEWKTFIHVWYLDGICRKIEERNEKDRIWDDGKEEKNRWRETGYWESRTSDVSSTSKSTIIVALILIHYQHYHNGGQSFRALSVFWPKTLISYSVNIIVMAMYEKTRICIKTNVGSRRISWYPAFMAAGSRYFAVGASISRSGCRALRNIVRFLDFLIEKHMKTFFS